MVWGTEIEFRTGGILDLFELMKLGTVVGGNRTNAEHLALDEFDDYPVELRGGSSFKLPNQRISRLAFHQGDDAMPVIGSDDRVDFPVTESGSMIGSVWSLGDVSFPAHNTARISRSVSFAAFLPALPKMLVEIAAAEPVVPDVSIKGLMADGEDPVPGEPVGDLFWAPIFANHTNCQAEFLVREIPLLP